MFSVLLAEDEPPLARHLAQLISTVDGRFQVEATVHNGVEALRVLGQKPFDVVFSDIRMPGKTGLQLIEALKDRAEISKQVLPIVVFLSGFRDFEYARAAVRLGALDYLLKPIDETQLAVTLDLAAKTLLKHAGEPHAPKDRSQVVLEDRLTSRVSADNIHAGLIQRILDYVDQRVTEDVTVQSVAAAFEVSPAYLSKIFCKFVGQTLVRHISQKKIDRAKQHLTEYPDALISEVAESVGFQDPLYFSKVFKKLEGCWPSEYRSGPGHPLL